MKWIKVEIAKKIGKLKVFKVISEKPNLAVILKSFFLSMLIIFSSLAVDVNQFNNFRYFDANKLTGGNVDKEGIRNFGNQQKNTWLSSPDSIKNNTGKSVGYDESKLNGNVKDIESENAKQQIINLMSNMTSGSKSTYKCYEERIVKVKNFFKCSLNNEIFDNKNLCNEKCIKQHECIQSDCIQTAQCEKLTAGFVCSIQKTQCQVSITCPPGGNFNANTGKCEAQPL